MYNTFLPNQTLLFVLFDIMRKRWNYIMAINKKLACWKKYARNCNICVSAISVVQFNSYRSRDNIIDYHFWSSEANMSLAFEIGVTLKDAIRSVQMTIQRLNTAFGPPRLNRTNIRPFDAGQSKGSRQDVLFGILDIHLLTAPDDYGEHYLIGLEFSWLNIYP